MNHVVNNRQKGFTLVELMLAMTFISVLLLAIALTVIQIGSLYNRGTTLKETNQAARDITSDFQRSVSSSEAFSMTTDYFHTDIGPASGTGRVCLGSYSYIWNLAGTPAGSTVKYLRPSKAGTRINLLKVPDTTKLYCALNAAGNLAQKDILDADTDISKEMLNAGDHSLVIYKFALVAGGADTADSLTKQQIYQLNFSISTNKLSAIDLTTGTCLPPGNINSDFNYCSVQDFSLVVRAGDRIN
jgi:prepilin-type N-terminal cleavage/methylation domain